MAATIEDEDEEDKEIMEVLGAEEVDTELDYEVDSEMTTITECSQKMKCILWLFSFDNIMILGEPIFIIFIVLL